MTNADDELNELFKDFDKPRSMKDWLERQRSLPPQPQYIVVHPQDIPAWEATFGIKIKPDIEETI